ncbi:MAG: C-GCAxxG-C-C family protein [Eubacteriales bacterium]|nr:C-GCAxxG-C-C family protein [Eubacteriales bacterium]
MKEQELRQYAGDCFLNQHYNCAEAVLKSMAAFWDIQSPLIPRIASGFGGGVANTHQHICGAVSGGIMAIGLALGRDNPNKSPKEIAQKTQAFLEYVKERNASTNCGDIIQVDFTKPDAAQHKNDARIHICAGLVEDCCVWLAENVEFIQ